MSTDPVLASLLDRYHIENARLENPEDETAAAAFEALEPLTDRERRLLDQLGWLAERIRAREVASLGYMDQVRVQYHDGRGYLSTHGKVMGVTLDRFDPSRVTGVTVMVSGSPVHFADTDTPLSAVSASDAHRRRKGLK